MSAAVAVGWATAPVASANSIAEAAPIHLAAATPPETAVLSLYPLLMVAAALIGLNLFFFMRWHKLPSLLRSDSVAITLPFLLFILMLLLEGIGVRVMAAAAGIDLGTIDDLPPRDSIRAMTILKSAEYAAALPIVAAAFWWQAQLRSNRWREPVPPRIALLIAAGAFLLAWPIVASTGLAGALIEEVLTGRAPDVIAHSTLEDLAAPDRGGAAWLLIALVVAGAAIFEETLYRGLLQESAKRLLRRRWAAIAAASLIFTAMHWGAVAWSAMPALFVLSLWLGWAYEKSDSLLPPIAAHMMFNALNIVLATTVAEGTS